MESVGDGIPGAFTDRERFEGFGKAKNDRKGCRLEVAFFEMESLKGSGPFELRVVLYC